MKEVYYSILGLAVEKPQDIKMKTLQTEIQADVT